MCRCVSYFLEMNHRTKDNLIYLGVAGIVVAALTFYIFYMDAKTSSIPALPWPVLWGVLSTLGITALILERFWKHRSRLALWIIVTVAAAVNISALFAAYSLQWTLPIIVWSTITVLWVIVVFIVAEKILA